MFVVIYFIIDLIKIKWKEETISIILKKRLDSEITEGNFGNARITVISWNWS